MVHDLDPRPSVIRDRLSGVARVVCVSAGKGGVGKSSVASTLALLGAEQGMAVGLLDLDLTGPTDHVILGARLGFPSEEYGIDPERHAGISFLSVAHFLGMDAAALRGGDVTNTLLELLAIARWGALDALVIDMPPGLGDTALDVHRYLPKAAHLVVSTPSRLACESVRRCLSLLSKQGAPVLGVVENMKAKADDSTEVAELAAAFGLRHLGSLPRDPDLESALGTPERVRATAFASALRPIATEIFGS
ncbi:MAG: P-loop NTPase [Deltaproteobacteria bacterium]|nr:P-loop NTPase [Deltaproteobacteria bacterium]